MDLTILEKMYTNTYNLTMIPFAVYEGNELKLRFVPNKSWIDLQTDMKDALNSKEEIYVTLTSQNLIFASFNCKNSPFRIICGPIKTMNISSALLRDIIVSNGLSLESSSALQKQLDSLPEMTIEYFACLLSAFYINTNHEYIPESEILSAVNFKRVEFNTTPLILARQEKITFGYAQPHNSYNFEKEMLFYIRNGLIDELHNMGYPEGYGTRQLVYGNTNLRYYQNLVSAQNTLISRAAIEGGADPESCYSLSDIYLIKIEQCKTLSELTSIAHQMKDDFCNLVNEIKYKKTNDKNVNKAIDYIKQHLQEKISASEIADIIGISKECLSTKFKKQTGMSIPDFINEQKVIIAKKLLAFSDYSLIEISNYLNYSSQSYFQTQFKKITGITPQEYRNKKTQK